MADTNVGEVWRPVVGFEGWYSVSSEGRVRRDMGGIKGGRSSHILAHTFLKAGYHKVTLSRRAAHTQVLVHRLVMAAFVGPCPAGHEVNHKDGDKDNNALANLEYVTPAQNIMHSVRVLGIKRPNPVPQWGEKHPHSKLTEQQVREIRAKYAAGGVRQKDLGREYGVGQTVVSHVVRRIAWPHVH